MNKKMDKKINKKIEFAKMVQVALLLLSAGAAYGMGEARLHNGWVFAKIVDEAIASHPTGPAPKVRDYYTFPGTEGIPSEEVEQNIITINPEKAAADQEDADDHSSGGGCGAVEGRMGGNYYFMGPEGCHMRFPLPVMHAWDKRLKKERRQEEKERQRIQKEKEQQEEKEQQDEDQIVEPTVSRGTKRKLDEEQLRPYKCGSCTRTFAHEGWLRTHEQAAHSIQHSAPFSPQDGGQQLANALPAAQRVMRAPAAMRSPAPVARNYAANRLGVIAPAFPCRQCGLSFIYESALRAHEANHVYEQVIREQAQRSAQANQQQALAVQRHPGVAVYAGDRMTGYYNKEHKRYYCARCDADYKGKGYLDRHFITHLPKSEWPWSCIACHERFTRADFLYSHQQNYCPSRA